MNDLTSGILIYIAITLLITIIIYSLIKIFIISFQYRKQLKDSNKRIEELINNKNYVQ